MKSLRGNAFFFFFLFFFPPRSGKVWGKWRFGPLSGKVGGKQHFWPRSGKVWGKAFFGESLGTLLVLVVFLVGILQWNVGLGCTSGEFMYLTFTYIPGESYCRWLRSLLLCLCDVFHTLINSLMPCWFCMSTLGLIRFQIMIWESLGKQHFWPQSGKVWGKWHFWPRPGKVWGKWHFWPRSGKVWGKWHFWPRSGKVWEYCDND